MHCAVYILLALLQRSEAGVVHLAAGTSAKPSQPLRIVLLPFCWANIIVLRLGKDI
jgi:hypothetical protein